LHKIHVSRCANITIGHKGYTTDIQKGVVVCNSSPRLLRLGLVEKGDIGIGDGPRGWPIMQDKGKGKDDYIDSCARALLGLSEEPTGNCISIKESL